MCCSSVNTCQNQSKTLHTDNPNWYAIYCIKQNFSRQSKIARSRPLLRILKFMHVIGAFSIQFNILQLKYTITQKLVDSKPFDFIVVLPWSLIRRLYSILKHANKLGIKIANSFGVFWAHTMSDSNTSEVRIVLDGHSLQNLLKLPVCCLWWDKNFPQKDVLWPMLFV